MAKKFSNFVFKQKRGGGKSTFQNKKFQKQKSFPLPPSPISSPSDGKKS